MSYDYVFNIKKILVGYVPRGKRTEFLIDSPIQNILLLIKDTIT